MSELSDRKQEELEFSEEYEQARKRVERKRKFSANLVAYVVINAFLIAVWAAGGMGYFWPGWVMAGWGIGLVLHGWQTYRGDRPITEEDIQREMD
jgi:fatty acid desaturase